LVAVGALGQARRTVAVDAELDEVAGVVVLGG
jgi:hypothetical protein